MKSLVQKTDEAQELVKTLIAIQTQTRKLGIVKGKVLWELKANNLFKKAFGQGVDTWEEFLRSPEIAMTVSEANRTMQLYEYFVLKYELSEDELADVPVKSLRHMLPRLKSGEIESDDIPELIGAASTLTFNEFKERMYDVQFEDENRTYKYIVMRKCNETKNLSKVVDISHEEILTVFPRLNESQSIHS